jgi:DNA-binding response OmpR family regulator
MLTAKTQEKDKILGKETGADEYITKPFEMDYLLKKVRAYLNK